ncbi:MAG TPA: N-acetyltransferase [bacterium]|nr:N-acetyltransferase [bacterium]
MIRKAKISDIKELQKLINFYAERGEMLPRSLNELYENLRDFLVFEEKEEILGCCALHVSWEDLGEIKSLTVKSGYTGKGIGKKLIEGCLKETKELGIKKVFALTYKPEYFKKEGFRKIEKDELPHKIWSECINCPKFPDCDEVAMLKEME